MRLLGPADRRELSMRVTPTEPLAPVMMHVGLFDKIARLGRLLVVIAQSEKPGPQCF